VKGANAAGNAVTSAARKLKTPAIAAGAGLAGVAGGIALARGSRKKLLGVSLPNGRTARSASKNLGNVAKNLGAFAERTGRVAEQVRVASEAIGESNTRSKSPVEVVLEGLTSRSQSRAGWYTVPRSAAKLDLDAVKSAAERVSVYGQQASDIVGAIEKTRKENK
jgi:hypothetical protein